MNRLFFPAAFPKVSNLVKQKNDGIARFFPLSIYNACRPQKGTIFLKNTSKKLIFGNNVNHFTTDDDQNTITYGILIPYIEFIISISICKKH